MTRKIELAAVTEIDLLRSQRSGETVGMNIGPDGAMYIVTAIEPPDNRIWKNGASFPKPVADRPRDYRVIVLAGGEVTIEVSLGGEQMNFPSVQPLSGDILLVGSRCEFRSADDIDKNGRVYSKAGKLQSAFVLGDGIADVQTTASGVIWTSYFDEGVFGNLGWDEPLGRSGLVAWDSSGKKLYEYEPPEGVGPIGDCYTMNVASDRDVWVYYYSDFPLVHIRDMSVHRVWAFGEVDSDMRAGLHAFAVSEGHVLFGGELDGKSVCHLFRLGVSKTPDFVGTAKLFDRLGLSVRIARVYGRGDILHMVGDDGSLYQLRVEQVVEALSRG